MNVLIVEDDRTARQVMHQLIAGRGHEITSCASAEEAEKQVESQRYDAIILDWMLPGKTGPEFCRWLRQRTEGEDYYVLLITARATAVDLDEALDAGANDYLVKPWEGEIFRSRLRIAERQVLDIADRRKSRSALRQSNQQLERLALVARQTQNGVIILNGTGHIEWANAAIGKMIPLGNQEFAGTHFLDLLAAVEPAQRLDLEEALAMGCASEGEVAVVKDDSQHWLHYSLTPLHPELGKSRGQVCLFSDITTVKLADEERFKTSKLESLGVLAGGIAHDLNNILTVISGNVSLARLTLAEKPEKALEHLDTADKAALRAATLSKQLLTFAKGGDPLKQVIDLKELIEKTTQFALYGSNLTCVFALSEQLQKVEADPYQIEQVINNVVINAREAMPHGGKLQVRAHNETLPEANPYSLPPGKYVRVCVSDNGPGIPADVLPQVFDPYFTTKPTGSGLGLSISFSIVSKHGGHLLAESVPSGGAVFILLLPIAEAEFPSQFIETLDANVPRTVLCMDDEPTIRDLTSAMLTMSGYEVVTTRDGEEAVAAYVDHMKRGRKFDAVILDATIPGGMGGVDTIKALIHLDPNVRAIICSGYSDESALAAMKSFGFKASLPKPFTSKQLASLLDTVIRQAA